MREVGRCDEPTAATYLSVWQSAVVTPHGCSTSCNALVKEIEGIVARTSEAPRFAIDLAAFKYKPPVINDHDRRIKRYTQAKYIAAIAQHAATRQMLVLDPKRISGEHDRVMVLRKLDAAGYALERLARDQVMAPATASWKIEPAITAVRSAYGNARKVTNQLLAQTRRVTKELERDLAKRKHFDPGASAAALDTIAIVQTRLAEVVGTMNVATESLDALDVRVDVDVSEHVPSKKRNPGKPGAVPDLLLGELLLRLMYGSDLTRHLNPAVAKAIVATRPKYIFGPRERRMLLDDGFGDEGRDDRYDRAIKYAKSVSPRS